jgi:carbonic anhydrase/acetyltransferase-like protein (isoleucine patch superfamily)
MAETENVPEIHPSVVYSQNTVYMKGKVKIGKGTSSFSFKRTHLGCIIHPAASIIAENGPIIIGEYNIIEERSLITNKGIKGPGGEL